jgi:hypothetical protein
MRKMMLLAGSIIPVCSSGSIGHGGSGRGTIAALSSKIWMAFKRAARACRVHTAAGVAGYTVAHLQKLYSNNGLSTRARAAAQRASLKIASVRPPQPHARAC